MLHLALVGFGISVLLNLVQTFKGELGPDEPIVAFYGFESIFHRLKLVYVGILVRKDVDLARLL